jgi:hypothetical protein
MRGAAARDLVEVAVRVPLRVTVRAAVRLTVRLAAAELGFTRLSIMVKQ